MRLKKQISSILAGFLCLMLVMGTTYVAKASEPILMKATEEVDIRLGENQAIVTGYAEEFVKFDVDIYNEGSASLTKVSVEPVAATDTGEFPFDISEMNKRIEIQDGLKGRDEEASRELRKKNVELEYMVRSDVKDGYVTVPFNIYYTLNGENYVQRKDIFFKMVGIPEPEPEPEPTPEPAPEPKEDPVKPIPRVIVTGYTTEPSKVQAGENFTLNLNVKNTSKTLAVSNLLFELTAPQAGGENKATIASEAFLPTSGSNSIYVDYIAPGGSTVLSIELNTKSDLEQKPYVIQLSMKYEDKDAKEYSSSADVSIPVSQQARFDVSTPEVSPESLSVGEEGNVSFNIHNTGKRRLFNAKVFIEDARMEKVESFIGNVDPGQTVQVDFSVIAIAQAKEGQKVKGKIIFEDESGKQEVKEFEFDLPVYEAIEEVPMPPREEEVENKSIVKPILFGFIAILILAIIILIIKKVKGKKNATTGLN